MEGPTCADPFDVTPGPTSSLPARRTPLTVLLALLIGAASPAAGGDEALCDGILVPPNVAIFRDARANAVYSAERRGWTIAIPDVSRKGNQRSDVKVDPTGAEAEWRGGCREAEADRRFGFVRVWLMANFPDYKQVWVQEAEVRRFRYPSPGDWEGQTSRNNLAAIRAAGTKAIAAQVPGAKP
jgi:hypothetical protein